MALRNSQKCHQKSIIELSIFDRYTIESTFCHIYFWSKTKTANKLSFYRSWNLSKIFFINWLLWWWWERITFNSLVRYLMSCHGISQSHTCVHKCTCIYILNYKHSIICLDTTFAIKIVFYVGCVCDCCHVLNWKQHQMCIVNKKRLGKKAFFSTHLRSQCTDWNYSHRSRCIGA